MSSLKVWYKNNTMKLMFGLGILISSLIALPYLLLGEGSYVQIHDQVDGEILNYIYQAKYLFQGNIIPEFMNGMDKASMTPPAPLGVIFYKLLPPFAAFAAMHWICLLTGFAGMFLLCRYCRFRAEVCFVTACVFCYIPFYPVYGLAALGQPLLVCSFLKLASGKKKPIGELIGIAFYGAMSSLTLIGYVWIVLGVLLALFMAGMRKKQEAKRVFTGTAVLVLVYLLTNMALLKSIFGDGFETHRSEMVLTATEDLLTKGKELLFVGGSYSPVYSTGILVVGLIFLCIGLWEVRKCRIAEMPLDVKQMKQAVVSEELKECIKAVLGVFVLIFVGILLAVLWNCHGIVNIRKAIGGMVMYFQADRIYWIFPFLWMFLMGWVLEGLALCGEICGKGFVKLPKAKCAVSILCGILFLGLIMTEGLQVLRDNTLNKNLRLVLFDNYEQVTWDSLFMEEVFDEIDEVIGEDKNNHSVVSLGIYPSVPLYNGYICADGYSNNYNLEYKHAFRKVIDAELEKNPEAKAYFDDWGNRLYLTAQPYGTNGMVAKGQGRGYTNVDFDAEAMKSLNIGYIFSAAPIEFAEKMDTQEVSFVLVDGSPFSDDASYYEVWVYRVR